MPGCSVNNTLMMGMESVAAMVATEVFAAVCRCIWEVDWAEEIDAVDGVCVCGAEDRSVRAWTMQGRTR